MEALVPVLNTALDALAGRPVFGFLLRGHGLYTWGRDLTHACRHAEAFDFLFACEMQLGRLNP